MLYIKSVYNIYAHTHTPHTPHTHTHTTLMEVQKHTREWTTSEACAYSHKNEI